MISATSPNQEGVEGTDSRSGLDTDRDIGDTRHVYLLVGKSFVLPHQGGIFLGWFATAYISLRNSWGWPARAGMAPSSCGRWERCEANTCARRLRGIPSGCKHWPGVRMEARWP